MRQAGILSLLLVILAVPGTALSPGTYTGRIGQTEEGKELLVHCGRASALLGLEPAELYALTGAPGRLYPLRGASEEQDDVVFEYDSGLSLFFYGNRIWQVRLLPPFELPLPLRFSTPRGRIIDLLGTPFAADEQSVVYLLPDRGYPVRLRLFFSGDGLDDIYLYRADY